MQGAAVLRDYGLLSDQLRGARITAFCRGRPAMP